MKARYSQQLSELQEICSQCLENQNGLPKGMNSHRGKHRSPCLQDVEKDIS